MAKEDSTLELRISVDVFWDVPQHLPLHVCDRNGKCVMLVLRLRNHHDRIICRTLEMMRFDVNCASGPSFVVVAGMCLSYSGMLAFKSGQLGG